MALRIGDKWYGGAEAILELARLGDLRLVDRLMRSFLGMPYGRKFRYGILVWLRKLLLKILGRSEISPPHAT